MEKPVFLVGCPRSGTTITLRLMSMHRDFAWVAQYQNAFPHRLVTSLYQRIYDIPVLGSRLRLKESRYLPRACEPWRFWTTHLKRFRQLAGGVEPPKPPAPDDMSEDEVRHIRRVIRALCRYQGKKRFMTKYTEFARIRYLRKAFPDAQFVHILRDGRAVVNSFHNKVRSGEFGNWAERDWWAAAFPAEWRSSFEKDHYTPVGLLGYLWKYFVRLIRQEAAGLSSQEYLEVRYTDLTRSPRAALETILAFCGLRMTRQFAWCLDRLHVSSADYKWKQELGAAEQQLLDDIFHEAEFRALLDD